MGKLYCKACNKVIHGQYIKALDANWHPECFCCAGCGQPITSQGFLTRRGKPYHPECFHEKYSPRCSGCSQPIEGEYIRALDKFWHPEHFVCAHCGERIGKTYLVHRGKPYCTDDYMRLFAEKCALCGQPLMDGYMLDALGNKYCQRHESDPRCSSCDRFIGQFHTGGGLRYADGRVICQECRSTAIDEVSDVYLLLNDVQNVLKKYDICFDPKLKINLQLLGQDELASRMPKRKRNQHAAGLTQTSINTINGFESSRELKGITMLYGLPYEHLGSVLAHELGHAWLFLNHYPKLPNKLEEGFCELLSTYWLQSRDNDLARVRLKLLEKNPDRVYGSGYRLFNKTIARYSLAYVLDCLKRHADLPDNA